MYSSMYNCSLSTPYTKGYVVTQDEYMPYICQANDLKEVLELVAKMLKNGFTLLDVHKIGSDVIHTITSLKDLEELKKHLLENQIIAFKLVDCCQSTMLRVILTRGIKNGT